MHDIGALENTPTTDKAERDAQTLKPTPPEPAPEQESGGILRIGKVKRKSGKHARKPTRTLPAS